MGPAGSQWPTVMVGPTGSQRPRARVDPSGSYMQMTGWWAFEGLS